MKRALIFAAVLVGSFAVVACAGAGDGQREDTIVCYSGGQKVFGDVGNIRRASSGAYYIARADGTKAAYTGDCVVEWDGGPEVN